MRIFKHYDVMFKTELDMSRLEESDKEFSDKLKTYEGYEGPGGFDYFEVALDTGEYIDSFSRMSNLKRFIKRYNE